MNEEYTLLELSVVNGKLSLLNSYVKTLDNTSLRLVKKHIDERIDAGLKGEYDIRDANTYQEVLDSSSSIDWRYYRYIVNEDGDGLCMGIIK